LKIPAVPPGLFYFANDPALKRRAIFRSSVGTTIFAPTESVFMAAETVTPNAPATSAIFRQPFLKSSVARRERAVVK
jgi:hypothetical protein